MRLAILIAQTRDRREAIAVSGPMRFTEATAMYRAITRKEAPLYDRAAEYPVLELWSENDGKVKSQRLKWAESEAEADAEPEPVEASSGEGDADADGDDSAESESDSDAGPKRKAARRRTT